MHRLSKIKSAADAFEREAHEIFARVEGARTRVITLHDSYAQLERLSILQDELFKEALQCIELGLFRAAHVAAWTAFIDFLAQKLGEDGLESVQHLRPKWKKFKTVEELCENVPEYQLIEVAREVKLLSKNEMKSLQGLLSKRNECAHPGNYRPSANEALGYVSELMTRLRSLSNKSLQTDPQ